jgi:hypothetical protein
LPGVGGAGSSGDGPRAGGNRRPALPRAAQGLLGAAGMLESIGRSWNRPTDSRPLFFRVSLRRTGSRLSVTHSR